MNLNQIEKISFALYRSIYFPGVDTDEKSIWLS